MAKYIKDKAICSQKIYTRLKKKKNLAAKPIARLALNAVSKDASRWQRYSGAGLYFYSCLHSSPSLPPSMWSCSHSPTLRLTFSLFVYLYVPLAKLTLHPIPVLSSMTLVILSLPLHFAHTGPHGTIWENYVVSLFFHFIVILSLLYVHGLCVILLTLA